MVLDTTSDTLEIVLGAAVAASQATFMCQYNEMSSSTLVPKASNGQTNNTTPVVIISAPSSSFQRQLKFLNIENNDTASMTVTIRFNNGSVTRTIFKATIASGENISFEPEKGWTSHDSNGNLELATNHIHRVGNIMTTELFLIAGYGSSTGLGTTPNIISLGRIPKSNSTSINFLYNVSTNGSSFNWAELAVYKLGTGGSSCPGQARAMTRMGTTTTTGIWNSTGIKNTAVSISNYNLGDHVYVIYAQSVSPNTASMFLGVSDQNNTGLLYGGNTTSATSWQPSLNFTYTIANFSQAAVLTVFQIN